jgi:hypothetical protein
MSEAYPRHSAVLVDEYAWPPARPAMPMRGNFPSRQTFRAAMRKWNAVHPPP